MILPDGNEEDEEDNMIEKKHRSGSKCGGIYGYQGGAFSKLINALQNSLAKDVEVSSSVGRMREKRDGTLASSRMSSSSKQKNDRSTSWSSPIRVCLKRTMQLQMMNIFKI